jgi:hypothetical protein
VKKDCIYLGCSYFTSNSNTLRVCYFMFSNVIITFVLFLFGFWFCCWFQFSGNFSHFLVVWFWSQNVYIFPDVGLFDFITINISYRPWSSHTYT